MSVRLLLNDSLWSRIEKILSDVKSKVGRPPDISDRTFLEAILYVARTGIPWRDLPDYFGNFSAIYNRLRRWQRNGTWQQLWQLLETDKVSLAEHLFIDTTCEGSSIPLHRQIRAHQHAAGASRKKGGQSQDVGLSPTITTQALGRSRGGFSTKIHFGCLDEKNALSIFLTGGEVPDVKGFASVFNLVPENHGIKNAIMDKGYDSDDIRETLADCEVVAVIPPKKNRIKEIDFDKELYKLRNKIERFINRMKQFRRIATRYEKLAETYLVFIYIVAVYVLLS